MWRTNYGEPPYAVKVVPQQTEEAEIYEQLLRCDPSSPNHTLPCDVIRPEAEQPFLIMPCLEDIFLGPERSRWALLPLLDFFHQVIEVSRMYAYRRHSRGFDTTYTGRRVPTRSAYRTYGEQHMTRVIHMCASNHISGHV